MTKRHNHFIIFILGLIAIIVFSCKKEEFPIENTNPGSGYDLDLPVYVIEKGSDIIITEDVYIDHQILVIEEGVTLRFAEGVKMVVSKLWPAVIIAKGTQDAPVNFIPYNSGGNQPDKYWGGVVIKNTSYPYVSTFSYCNFIKGCDEEHEAVLKIENGYAGINNCYFDYSKNAGIKISYLCDLKEFDGNTIKHTLSHPLITYIDNIPVISENNFFQPDSVNKGILVTKYGYNLKKSKNANGKRENIIWNAQSVPYIITDHDFKLSGDNITLKPGTKIAFDYKYDGTFKISGISFKAIGTPDNPIVFTSNKLQKKPGDWGSILIYGSNTNAQFSNCIFEYGGKSTNYSGYKSMIYLSHSTNCTIDSCIFRYSETTAVKLEPNNEGDNTSLSHFDYNEFYDIPGIAIKLPVYSVSYIGEHNSFNGNMVSLRGNQIKNRLVVLKDIGTPYFPESTLRITGSNSKLVIEPGVMMKFRNSYIYIDGEMNNILECKGTAEKPVVFTSCYENPQKGDWGGLLFGNGTSPATILEYCKILYAGTMGSSYKGAIRIKQKVTVRNCEIGYSRNWGIVYNTFSDPLLENNIFYYNEEGDIFGTGN